MGTRVTSPVRLDAMRTIVETWDVGGGAGSVTERRSDHLPGATATADGFSITTCPEAGA
jgi:hypothetical protein